MITCPSISSSTRLIAHSQGARLTRRAHTDTHARTHTHDALGAAPRVSIWGHEMQRRRPRRLRVASGADHLRAYASTSGCCLVPVINQSISCDSHSAIRFISGLRPEMSAPAELCARPVAGGRWRCRRRKHSRPRRTATANTRSAAGRIRCGALWDVQFRHCRRRRRRTELSR